MKRIICKSVCTLFVFSTMLFTHNVQATEVYCTVGGLFENCKRNLITETQCTCLQSPGYDCNGLFADGVLTTFCTPE